MHRKVSEIPIRGKLALLAAISAIGFAVVGAAIAYEAKINTKAAAARVTTTGHLTTLHALDESLSESRRLQRDMIIRRDLSIGNRAISANRQARTTIDALAADTDPSLAADIAEIRKLIDRYGRHLDELITFMRRIGLNETEGQQGNMRQSIREAEGALNQLGYDKIVVSVLQLRRHEKDFQLREAKANADLHSAEMERLKSLLDGPEIPEQARKGLLDKVDAYAKAFDALVASISARNTKIAELDGGIASLDPLVAKLRESVAKSAAEASERIDAQLENVAKLLWTVIVVTLALVVAASALVGRSISIPIVSLTREMERLGQGETDISVRTEGRNEIAEMGRSLLIFRDNLVAQRKLEAEAAAAQRAQIERAHRIAVLTDEFQDGVGDMLEATARAAGELEATARSLEKISESAREMSVNAATGANEASTNVQTVAAAADELAASIREISRQVAASSERAGHTTTLAAGSETRVRELEEVAQRIGDVVKLIHSIAAQTNLLALNATIEAARAGDAGRGFAIVANEVKTLAAQTAKATEEIGSQIAMIQNRTSDVVGAMSEIGGAIRNISEMTSSVASAIEEQTAATQEIGRNAEQAAAGVEDTNRAIAGVRSASEETGMASGGVLDASAQVAAQADALGKRVRAFLEAVRAA